MALIYCPECKEKISDSIKKCPHCGFVNNHTFTVAKFAVILIGIIIVGLTVSPSKKKETLANDYSSAPITIESNARLNDYFEKNNFNALSLLVAEIQLKGNRCDSVSYANVSSWDGSVTVQCNVSQYEYNFKDIGGVWTYSVIR